MLPAASALAQGSASLSVNLPGVIVAGEPAEFTVTSHGTTAQGLVKGTFSYDASKVAKLEYYETAGNAGWRELTGDSFGPSSGFPLTDGATSRFRVTFKEGGTFATDIQLKAVNGGAVVAQATPSFIVKTAPTLTVNLPGAIVAGEPAEFTVTSHGQTTLGAVKGYFSYDADKVEKLEYYETFNDAGWRELTGDSFGPDSGFPLTDSATSRFRVTFKEPGTFTTDIKLVAVDGGTVVAQATPSFTVAAAPSLTVDLPDTFAVGQPTEFTVTSHGQTTLGAVKGYFSYDADKVKKLEYYETFNDAGWRELTGDSFGPESGFPLTDGATSRFRVTFKEAGEFEASIQLKAVTGGAVVAQATPSFTAVHVHNPVAVEGKAPTCTEAGNIAYWYCTDCGKYFSDAACTKEIALSDTELAVIPHDYQDGKCTMCGAVDTASLPLPQPADPAQTGDAEQTETGAASTTPKTGQSNDLVLWAALMLAVAGITAGGAAYAKKRNARG
nr:hypothetical protein [Clostridium sp. BSD2780061688b_171218_E8]